MSYKFLMIIFTLLFDVSIAQLEKEIKIAKNDMIAAYHERIEHFEKKLNVKEKVEKKTA